MVSNINEDLNSLNSHVVVSSRSVGVPETLDGKPSVERCVRVNYFQSLPQGGPHTPRAVH